MPAGKTKQGKDFERLDANEVIKVTLPPQERNGTAHRRAGTGFLDSGHNSVIHPPKNPTQKMFFYETHPPYRNVRFPHRHGRIDGSVAVYDVRNIDDHPALIGHCLSYAKSATPFSAVYILFGTVFLAVSIWKILKPGGAPLIPEAGMGVAISILLASVAGYLMPPVSKWGVAAKAYAITLEAVAYMRS